MATRVAGEGEWTFVSWCRELSMTLDCLMSSGLVRVPSSFPRRIVHFEANYARLCDEGARQWK